MVRDYVHNTIPGSRVVYIDTDSVFVYIPTLKNIEESFKIGKQLAIEITRLFTGTMRIQHEKSGDMLLWRAKNYVLLKYERLDKPPKIEIKGATFIKGDSCLLNKTFGEELVSKVLKEDEDSVCKYIQEKLSSWISNWAQNKVVRVFFQKRLTLV